MVADANIDGGACACFDMQNDAALRVVGFVESTSAYAPAAEFFQCVDFEDLTGGYFCPGYASRFAMKW